jgi:acyl-coenzyme A thioesterase PaaI-like protein
VLHPSGRKRNPSRFGNRCNNRYASGLGRADKVLTAKKETREELNVSASPLKPVVSIAQLQQLISSDTKFLRGYGFIVREIQHGSCTLLAPFLAQFERPGGIVSGPIFMAAADVAFWLAIKTVRGFDDPSVTTHMQTQFLSSAREESFLCVASVLHAGKRTAYGTAECRSEQGVLLAHHTLTYATPRQGTV